MTVRKLNLQLHPIKIKVYLDNHLEWHELSFLEKENVYCDSAAKELILNKTRLSVPFPFQLSSPYFLTPSGTILSSSSDLYLQLSIIHTTPYLQKKLQSTDLHSIDFPARFRAFQTLPHHLHLWASKSFCNFTGTANRIHQQGLWPSSLCRCCNSIDECNTSHILICECNILSDYRTLIMEAFHSNCTRLDGDGQTVELLLSFMFGEPIHPATHLTHLY